MTNARDNVYAQVPQVNLEKFIISNEQVTKELHDHFTSVQYDVKSDEI